MRTCMLVFFFGYCLVLHFPCRIVQLYHRFPLLDIIILIVSREVVVVAYT
jgi:hypothetical protein